uniref:Uncharacterized protein n=1 Tax=Timema genevievae TaxID=629358 RepID=A0A7R9PNW9_TIMGE|nr:unnamed protein product [Timema genevievae]
MGVAFFLEPCRVPPPISQPDSELEEGGAAKRVFELESNGSEGLINKGLSARLFRPLSRLSYCIFLTHLGVLHYGVSRIKSARYMDDYNIVHDFAGDVTVTVVLSVILYVTFESPFLAVTKILTDKINKIRRQENNNMIKPVI